MMTTETAVMLAKYSDWADQVLFNAMESLPKNAIYQESGTHFLSMVGTLNHNYMVDLIWRANLLSQKHGFSSRRDVLFPMVEDLYAEQKKINQWYLSWAEKQTPASLEERLKFDYVSGRSGEMRRGGMFLHVVNHKTYHRGWVSEMFFDFGAKPPETDLCIFLENY